MPSNSSTNHSSEQGLQQELQGLGVRLLAKEDVQAMLRASCEALGAGKQGSCVLSVDPATQQKVVIKTFKQRKVDAFLVEVRNMQRFSGVPGVQQLVGVCLQTNQQVTQFAGCTVGEYFQHHVPFSTGVTVFLQLARAVQTILAQGYTHNDLKKDNLCVRDTTAGPVATIIDLGIATPLGTLRVFNTKDPEDFPSEPPELHTHTHPTSEASDAYRFAYSVKEALRLRPGAPHAAPVLALITWLEEALLPDPAQRPPVAALVRALELLHQEPLSVSPPRLTTTDHHAGGDGETGHSEAHRLNRRRHSDSGAETMKRKRDTDSNGEQTVKRRRESENGEERMKRKRESVSTGEGKVKRRRGSENGEDRMNKRRVSETIAEDRMKRKRESESTGEERVKRRRGSESSMERQGEEECESSTTGRLKRKREDESAEQHNKRKRENQAGDHTTKASLEKKRRKGSKNRRQRKRGGSSLSSSRCEDSRGSVPDSHLKEDSGEDRQKRRRRRS